MAKKRKIKKKPLIILSIIIVLIISLILSIQMYKHFTSYEYKLKKTGYNQKEINILLKQDKKVINKALKKYDEDLIYLSKQKYFIWKNYNKYKNYINEIHKKTNKTNYNNVIIKVNTNRNYELYTHLKNTNMKKDNKILVNKYYHLDSKYIPTDLVNISNQYCFGTGQVKKEVYESFIKMFNDAKKENITLIINSSYRSYDDQSKTYNEYKEIYGEKYADAYAARPGHSEHQTGLTLDIITYGANKDNFDKTEAFKWLSKNAYKYGFILRYPKGKEDITGYSYESWHYRYLGKKTAKKVYKSKLTYDEYYAYYEE